MTRAKTALAPPRMKSAAREVTGSTQRRSPKMAVRVRTSIPIWSHGRTTPDTTPMASLLVLFRSSALFRRRWKA